MDKIDNSSQFTAHNEKCDRFVCNHVSSGALEIICCFEREPTSAERFAALSDYFYDRLQKTWMFPKNKAVVIQYFSICGKGQDKTDGSDTSGVFVGKKNIYRLEILRLLSEVWLKKEFNTASKEDWAGLCVKFEEDTLRNSSGNRYSQKAKAKNYVIIRKFLKWLSKNNIIIPDVYDKWNSM